MAVYPVQISADGMNFLGVLNSSSMTMFSPTFDDEKRLAAFMFAYHYSDWDITRDYTECAQEKFALEIHVFLNQNLGEEWDDNTVLPAPWLRYIAENITLDAPEDVVHYTASDIEDGVHRLTPYAPNRLADFVMGEFRAWQKAQVVK